MKTNIFKAVLIGVLAGVLIFFMPFVLFRVLIVILIVSLIFRLSGHRRRWGPGNGNWGFWNNPANMQRWCSMSDAQRKSFKEKMERELFASTTNNPS